MSKPAPRLLVDFASVRRFAVSAGALRLIQPAMQNVAICSADIHVRLVFGGVSVFSRVFRPDVRPSLFDSAFFLICNSDQADGLLFSGLTGINVQCWIFFSVFSSVESKRLDRTGAAPSRARKKTVNTRCEIPQSPPAFPLPFGREDGSGPSGPEPHFPFPRLHRQQNC